MKASKLVHKILKFINYANLCKFTEPRKGPGGCNRLFFYFNFFFYIIITFFFFHVPFGASYLYFSHSNFLIFSPFPGASNVYFLTSRKLYHMKFAIFDVARCRMSATSLTFLLWVDLAWVRKAKWLDLTWVDSSHIFSSSGPKDPMSLCHGVASVVRPSVLPSVRPSVRPSLPSFRPSVRPQFSKCFFFVISQPILILIVS